MHCPNNDVVIFIGDLCAFNVYAFESTFSLVSVLNEIIHGPDLYSS